MKQFVVVVLAIMVLCSWGDLDACSSSFIPLKSNMPERDQKRESIEMLPGQTFSRTAYGITGVTYHVSVPQSYKQGDLLPILIAFSPGGDGLGILNKIKAGTERAGWIVVGCDSLRNNFGNPDLAVKMEDEILDDLFKNVPHDARRVYLGGFSGGAWRAYSISARRKEPFAGILAYGGWLGGVEPQNDPYCENMSVAMINGISDLGANAWVAMDTHSLQNRNCTVKHFSFNGAHAIAPAEVTQLAVDWLDDQWKLKQEDESDLLNLNLLYVGGVGQRRTAFRNFLSPYFNSFEAVLPDSINWLFLNRADVLILDTIVRSIPEGCTRSMLLIGPSAALTGEYCGSKIDLFSLNYSNEASMVNGAHQIFKEPIAVFPEMSEMKNSDTDLKLAQWSVESPQPKPGLISSLQHFQGADDSEVIACGRSPEGVQGVTIAREANRFLWGFSGSPEQMSRDAKSAFVNALCYIHLFDGHQQSVFRALRSRNQIEKILNNPRCDKETLMRWFPMSLLNRFNFDRDSLKHYFESRLDYVYVPHGSGLLQIDTIAEALKTPNNELASLEKWIEMLKGKDRKVALGLLLRYTTFRARGTKLWKDWYQKNKNALIFKDEEGYQFF